MAALVYKLLFILHRHISLWSVTVGWPGFVLQNMTHLGHSLVLITEALQFQDNIYGLTRVRQCLKTNSSCCLTLWCI